MLDFSDRLPPTQPQVSAPEAPPVVASAFTLPEIGSRYRHHKGGLYEVKGLCTVEATLEPGVLYQTLDPLARQDTWLRPVANFLGPVSAGGAISRFSALRSPSSAPLKEKLGEDVVAAHALESVLAQYRAPWRFYHDTAKLYRMFELAKERQIPLSLEQSFALLMLYAVYYPGTPQGQNEKQSIAMLHIVKPFVKVTVDWDLVSRIIEDSGNCTPTVSESKTVLDLDLSTLGDSPLEFCAADELLWLENRHLLDPQDARKDFDTRRLRYLLSLTAQGHLYRSALTDLEEVARTNIEGLRQAWVQKYQAR